MKDLGKVKHTAFRETSLSSSSLLASMKSRRRLGKLACFCDVSAEWSFGQWMNQFGEVTYHSSGGEFLYMI